ncbi:unnamed protein product [Linum trigynum]|uniref:Uncharacterized protein n=1 Tax=Linum trigynum TaxID=586398 RepID=A0AAV2GK81_9ROSI
MYLAHPPSSPSHSCWISILLLPCRQGQGRHRKLRLLHRRANRAAEARKFDLRRHDCAVPHYSGALRGSVSEGLVDYVNYQFYTDKVRNPVAYLAAFRLRAGQFGKEKLLPSYEVNGRGIQGDGFFDALAMLERNGFDVNGVMIFSADASAAAGVNFEYEKNQKLPRRVSGG